MVFKFRTFQKITQIYDAVDLVRDLDPDGRFSGDRRLDTDIRRREIQLDIVR